MHRLLLIGVMVFAQLCLSQSYAQTTTNYAYDELGRLTEVIYPTGDPTLGDSLTPRAIALSTDWGPSTGTWFDQASSTYTPGTAIDGLDQPAVIAVGGGLAWSGREYYRAAGTVDNTPYRIIAEFNFGSSHRFAMDFYDGYGAVTVETIDGDTPTIIENTQSYDVSNIQLYTVGGHKVMSFDVVAGNTGPVSLRAIPGTSNNGETVIVYTMNQYEIEEAIPLGATLTPRAIIASTDWGAGTGTWYDQFGSTFSTGTAVDSLPTPAVVVVGGGLDYSGREYYRGSGIVDTVTYRVTTTFNIGTSGRLYINYYDGSGAVWIETIGGATPTVSWNPGSFTVTNLSIQTVGSHKVLTFDIVCQDTGDFGVRVVPGTTTNGHSVTVYTMDVQEVL